MTAPPASPSSDATPRHPLAWLPNALTMGRIVLAPVLLWLLIDAFASQGRSLLGLGHSDHLMAAGLVLALAGVLDFLDGRLARAWKVESAFGQFWDPVADKLIIAVALVGLSLIFPYIAPAAAMIIARDAGVTVLRLTPRGRTIRAPSKLAKVKTVVEFAGLLLVLFWAAPFRFDAHIDQHTAELLGAGMFALGLTLLYAAAALSLITGVIYARASLRPGKGPRPN